MPFSASSHLFDCRLISCTLITLTLTLIQPVSNWTHWATPRRHPCLSRAATSASSQVNPIFRRSLLTRPSSSLLVDLVLSCILVPANTVLAVVCAGGPYGSPAKSSFSQYVVHGLLSSSGSDLHISYPVFP